jgi:hypothetical protein
VAWLGYREEWADERPNRNVRRFSFRSVGLTIHFGWKNDLSLPKTRFVRTDDVIRPGLHVQRYFRSARSGAGSGHPERNMRTRPIIIGGEFREDPPQVILVEHDQMIDTFAPDRPDKAFKMPFCQDRVKTPMRTAERTVGPARMIAESLTSRPGIREQHRPTFLFLVLGAML